MIIKKDILYKDAKSYLYDKDRYCSVFVRNYINKLQSAFVYDGLPDTLPKEEMERQLLTKGCTFVTSVDGDLYALDGTVGGEGDAYNRPTLYTVANAYLRLSATYRIGIDGVLVKNDYCQEGVLPLLYRQAAKMCDLEMTVNMMAIAHRMSYMISAPDDKTKASAELFMRKLLDGEYSVIGENAFFDGIKLQSPPTGNGSYLVQYIELLQYEKATLLNELGLNANYNMKRERLNDGEIALNIDAILPLIDNMYHERAVACDAINAMYGTAIKVDLGSAWKALREEKEKAVATNDTVIDILGESGLSSTDADPIGNEDGATHTENGDTHTEDGDTHTEDGDEDDDKKK